MKWRTLLYAALVMLFFCVGTSQKILTSAQEVVSESETHIHIPDPPPDPDQDMPASWKSGESEYATEDDGTIKPVKNPNYNLRNFRKLQIKLQKHIMKKQFRKLNASISKKYRKNFNVSLELAQRRKAAAESSVNCVTEDECMDECDKFWFNRNHLSWHVDRDNLTDTQLKDMQSSKCYQGCCLRRGEAYRYCSKQCWQWYIVEVKDRLKNFLECKTGCDLRCKSHFVAVANDVGTRYCDKFKPKQLKHFVPNITPNLLRASRRS